MLVEYSDLRFISARIGYLHNYDERDFTFGAGVRLGVFKINYALTPFGVFDTVSRVSIGISK